MNFPLEKKGEFRIMKTSAQIFLLAVLALTFALSTYAKKDYAKRKLLVTKQVLAEYVEHRLNQLEGREKLDEEEAVELNFIRQNRHNLQQLADFYGMKIKEKIPERISAREKPTASEIQEESAREISQSQPITPDIVRLERESGRIEAISTETLEPEEKPVGSKVNEEMAEGKRAEEVEEKIAKRDIVGDERATSPLETSSPLVESETALTAQKSVPQPSQLNHTNDQKDTQPLNEYDAPSNLKDKSISVARLPADPNSPIEAEEPIFESKAPSLIATEEEVRQFFADYMERYTQKDIDGFLSLFSPQAVQNQRDGFDEITKMYSDFFDGSQELRYHIEGMRIDIYQNAVEAKGHYTADQILKKRGKKKIWRGDIRWILVRENGALRIRFLDFRPQKSQ
jgi:hypothetical protein